MKAIRVSRAGGPEVMVMEEAETPKPGSKQVRVRLKAAGLNFIDIYQRRGEYPVQVPYTPGLEGAGVVDEVGSSVTDFKAGDRVAYVDKPGSYAEMSIVDAERLVRLPAELSFEQGAAFPLQGMTAHYLLHEYHQPRQGETVLIHAAGGGVGLLLVQWAKHLGARVIGTVSNEEKAAAAKQAGADHIIYYNRTNFAGETLHITEDRGADLIIDGVGKSTFQDDLRAVKVHGNIIVFGAASGLADPVSPNLFQEKSIRVSGGSLFHFISTRGELLGRARAVMNAVFDGWLHLHIGKTLPLEQAAEAHRLLEGRHSIGKVLLRIEQ